MDSKIKKKINLIVTIDTEEDNWGIYRSGVTTKNIFEVVRLQELFDRYDIRPTYLVTYQVAKSAEAAGILKEIQQSGKCEIGAHLHPWNTDPIIEGLDKESSMLGNLPIDLQREKIKTLIDQLLVSFGQMPMTFRAGRWGLRNTTVTALIDTGFKIDTSLTPLTSWESEGLGQVFNHYNTEPCWVGAEENNTSNCEQGKRILELPVSIGFNRWPPQFWDTLYNHFKKRIYRPLHPLGVLHHTKLLRKIWLSPEINPPGDMIVLARKMIAKGKTLLNFTFHTPSLMAGCGPFVKSSADLERFYQSIERFLQYVAGHPLIRSITPSEIVEDYSRNTKDCCTLQESICISNDTEASERR